MRRLPIVLSAAVLLIVLATIAIGTGVIAIPGAATTGVIAIPGAATTGPVAAASSAPSSAASSSPPSTREPTGPRPTAGPYIATDIERPDLVARLQEALDEGRVALAAPGIQASVTFADGRHWTGVSGVADLATGRALTLDTPFAIASASKTFLAAEVLLLVDAGLLSLDDAPARLLPATLVAGAPIDPLITVRMLLDHTSGLGDYLTSRSLDEAVQADPLAVWTPAQSLAHVGPTAGQPGQGYHYANTNYVLLGMIVEQITGRTLAEEFRARFFNPLGLSSASYQGAEPPAAELPTSYRYSSIRLEAKPQDVTDGTDIRPFTAITTATGAAGSLAMSARDLAHWARVLYGGRVLPPDLLELMVGDAAVTQTLDPPFPYGLGVQVFTIDGRISYGHSGRLVGARSTVRWFPDEGLAIAIVTNESRFDTTPILREMLSIVAPREIGSALPPG